MRNRRVVAWILVGLLVVFLGIYLVRFHAFGLLIFLPLLAVPSWFFGMALAQIVRRVNPALWIVPGLLVLAGLLVPTSLLVEFELNIPQTLPPPVAGLSYNLLFWLPTLALMISGLLLYSGLRYWIQWQAGRGSQDHVMAWTSFTLSALLLARTFYNLYWLLIWDNTNDSIEIFYMVMPIAACVVSGAMLQALPGKLKLARLYALVVPALLVALVVSAKQVDYRRLTEVRAARVSQAIEAYHAREGRYPDSLQQVTPWYAPSLPGPAIISPTQGWCYDGGQDYYRLGYVDRSHWSDPRLVGQTYTAKGELPDHSQICHTQMAAIRQSNPTYYRILNDS